MPREFMCGVGAFQQRCTPRAGWGGARDGLGTHICSSGAWDSCWAGACAHVRVCALADAHTRNQQVCSWALCALLAFQGPGPGDCWLCRRDGAACFLFLARCAILSRDCVLPRPGAVPGHVCNRAHHSLHSAMRSECAACAPIGRCSAHWGTPTRPLCRQNVSRTKRARSPSC